MEINASDNTTIAEKRMSSRANSQRWQTRLETHRWGSTEVGAPGTLDYRLLFIDRQWRMEISPLHNIPIFNKDNHVNFVCKTPRGLKTEYEIAEDEMFTPLKRRNHLGQPACYAVNAVGNFGMVPQTFADSSLPNEDYGGLKYDGTPLELLDIGSKKRRTGHVYSVKPLCAFAVVNHDISNISWKIIGIASDDPMAACLNDASDIQRLLPGNLESIREWFRVYRRISPDDKESVFGFNERPADLKLVVSLLVEAHSSWKGKEIQEKDDLSAEFAVPEPQNAKPPSLSFTSFMRNRVHVLNTQSTVNSTVPVASSLPRSKEIKFSGNISRVSIKCDACSEEAFFCRCSSSPISDKEDDIPRMLRNSSSDESEATEYSESSGADSPCSLGSASSTSSIRGRGKGKGKRVSWGWVETHEIPPRSLSVREAWEEKMSEINRYKLGASTIQRRIEANVMRKESDKSVESNVDPVCSLPARKCESSSSQVRFSVSESDVEEWHRKSWEAMQQKFGKKPDSAPSQSSHLSSNSVPRPLVMMPLA